MRLYHLLPAFAGAAAQLAGCADAPERPGHDHVASLLSGTGTNAVDVCALLDCGAGSCDPIAVRCECAPGDVFDGLGCVARPTCTTSDDCATASDCTLARGDAGTCVVSLQPGCAAAPCPAPTAPVLEPIAEEVLPFSTADGLPMQIRWETLPEGLWIDGDTVPIGAFAGRAVQVQARIAPGICIGSDTFEHTYIVTARYPGPPGSMGSDAVAHDDPRIEAWAARVVSYTVGEGVDEQWRDPARALGPAIGTPFDVVSLGEGGDIVLELAELLADADGYELAVFENAFDDGFLELARVGVSSDGVVWAYFDTATLAAVTPDPWRMLDVRDLGGFAGRFRTGWGSPFDLAWLRHQSIVRSGGVDLSAVRYVRVADIVGDGLEADSFGRPVVDPWPSEQSAGFDLDAVAVMGPRPSR